MKLPNEQMCLEQFTCFTTDIDMKKQIRQGVFETNSSSTHSLQIAKTDKAKDIIYKAIIDKYEESLDGYSPYDENDKYDLLKNYGSLELKGFKEEYSDEQTFTTQVITDPILKIQYLFGCLYEYLRNSYFFKNSDYYSYEMIDEVKNGKENDFIYQTKEYGFFQEAVLEYLKSNEKYSHVNRLFLSPDSKHGIYGGELDNGVEPSMFSSKEKFLKKFEEVMDDENSIITMDVPYHMYGSPNLKIYC